MDELAERLDGCAARMGDAARTLAHVGLSGDAFGPPLPGRLGEATRALRARWVAATGDLSREAAMLAVRLEQTATAVRAAAAGYADSDAAAARREP
jgi:hypothetical protein